ncbi:TetR/AcrR family transcriptional regulator [Eubacteriales bacterium OttesenSCG-928-K08]|nr:TetR/AcrR family transcriptional regulator [Eubacteriales bacterium OttesenSCG-928-K08]
MKREEKNLHSRRKILDAALREFAAQGYGLSSINTICSEGDISKGVLYHYFKDKDEIYLACVNECFDMLTAHLQEHTARNNNKGVQAYFDARLLFFKKQPLYQRLFCDALISPPPHLKEEICKSKEAFDALNVSVLTNFLRGKKLRDSITMEQAIETFRLFQDFVNARYQMQPGSAFDIAAHEEVCSRSLNILLYGVMERGAKSHGQ